MAEGGGVTAVTSFSCGEIARLDPPQCFFRAVVLWGQFLFGRKTTKTTQQEAQQVATPARTKGTITAAQPRTHHMSAWERYVK